MYRTQRKFQNIYAFGNISITKTPISMRKWHPPPWLPHVNAKSFCLLLAWASNLSIVTLAAPMNGTRQTCVENQLIAKFCSQNVEFSEACVLWSKFCTLKYIEKINVRDGSKISQSKSRMHETDHSPNCDIEYAPLSPHSQQSRKIQ